MEDTHDLSAQMTILHERVHQWVDRLQSDGAEPEAFREAVGDLRAAVDGVGRAAFLQLVEACEVFDETLIGDGQVYRFKQTPDKEWLTLWGQVTVPRRQYQPDRGGSSWTPLDERCSMVNRFMVPELERMTTFLGARLVPAEVEESLSEALRESPSRTAIRNVLKDVGQCAEDHAEELEERLQATARLDPDGDTLVGGWDGVTVPLREPAPKRGRPPERPMDTDTGPVPTAWKEASVGMVATYLTPLDPKKEDPERVDVRYASRMPESKMVTLIDGLVGQTEQALQQGCYHERVLLADGRREIWRAAGEHAVFDDFTCILDFYHATDHLSKAAEHLFGKGSDAAQRWYQSWRHKLKHDAGAVHGLIRSLWRYRRKLGQRSQRYCGATCELKFFRNNRNKMDYAGYRARGLIISSGPVEAAAKTIVGQRLKRSGMRWTRQGGQQILNLRVHVQSKRFDAFWKWYLKHTDVTQTMRHAA